MPANRNALVRYKTIDRCLKNRQRLWTLNDLIDACSNALYEYEGIDKGVSKRTIQADIQLMRSDKLGYNAPIVVTQKKYYTYTDDNYSITNIPITEQDLERLNETVAFLKQFKGFSHFKDLGGMVQKLEDHVHTQKTNHAPIIDFEKNENLKGLSYLDQLYQAIIKQNILKISYQSFRAREISSFNFRPLLLKEYRNRWFLLGNRQGREDIINLALDRIELVESTEQFFYTKIPFDANEYFKNSIGVTVNNVPPENVVLYILHRHAPYVLTKPLHWSQQEIDRDNYGVTIQLEVQHNFELEKAILGLGEFVKVVSPRRLRQSIKERLIAGVEFYETELSISGLQRALNQLTYKGFSNLHYVYTKREIRKLKKELDKGGKELLGKSNSIVDLNVSRLVVDTLLNKNLSVINEKMGLLMTPKSIVYYEFCHQENCCNHWMQFGENNLESYVVRIYLDDDKGSEKTLQLVPGSHKELLSPDKIKTITQNCNPYISEVSAGGIQLLHPLTLRFLPQSINQKKIRIVELVFEMKT